MVVDKKEKEKVKMKYYACYPNFIAGIFHEFGLVATSKEHPNISSNGSVQEKSL